MLRYVVPPLSPLTAIAARSIGLIAQRLPGKLRAIPLCSRLCVIPYSGTPRTVLRSARLPLRPGPPRLVPLSPSPCPRAPSGFAEFTWTLRRQRSAWPSVGILSCPAPGAAGLCRPALFLRPRPEPRGGFAPPLFSHLSLLPLLLHVARSASVSRVPRCNARCFPLVAVAYLCRLARILLPLRSSSGYWDFVAIRSGSSRIPPAGSLPCKRPLLARGLVLPCITLVGLIMVWWWVCYYAAVLPSCRPAGVWPL
jgi:hypothetical protein